MKNTQLNPYQSALLARQQLNEGNYNAAIENFTEALVEWDFNAFATIPMTSLLYDRARCHQKLGQYRQAVKDYEDSAQQIHVTLSEFYKNYSFCKERI